MAHPPPSAVREFTIAAGCQFRGADDSLPLVVANLVSLGVDLLLLVDHGNESIPLAQVRALTDDRCQLRVLRKSSPSYAQPGVHSMLMRIAQDSGAHAYLHVDADEMPDDVEGGPTFRASIESWLAEGESDALLIPHQNYLQGRDVDRWSIHTLDAPQHRVLGPLSAERADEAGYFGRTAPVRAMARLPSPAGAARWVRWGSHRLHGHLPDDAHAVLSMEASPHVVMRHVPYPSRSALEARVDRARSERATTDNRGSTPVTWQSVSMPTAADDPHPGLAVRTAPDGAFARIRRRIDAAGLTAILADSALAEQRTSLESTDVDQLFTSAADLLAATVRPRYREEEDGDTID